MYATCTYEVCTYEGRRSASVSSSTVLLYFLKTRKLMNLSLLVGQWSADLPVSHPPQKCGCIHALTRCRNPNSCPYVCTADTTNWALSPLPNWTLYTICNCIQSFPSSLSHLPQLHQPFQSSWISGGESPLPYHGGGNPKPSSLPLHTHLAEAAFWLQRREVMSYWTLFRTRLLSTYHRMIPN